MPSCIRPSSKTRTATLFLHYQFSIPKSVAYDLPAKQGLQLECEYALIHGLLVAYGLPAKQGLQLELSSSIICATVVAYGLPAKQGLQLELSSSIICATVVAYGLPAKQGLQHYSCTISSPFRKVLHTTFQQNKDCNSNVNML